MNTVVAEISSASQEQSTGIAEVGTAITHMDQTTQQNAALVEESAAAADSLKSQAAQLVEAVAVFRLAPGSDASAGASPSHRSTTSPGNGRSSGAGAPRLLAR